MNNFTLTIYKNLLKTDINYCFTTIVAVILLFSSCKDEKKGIDMNDPWLEMAKIEESISSPVFSDKEYNILAFGATTDSLTMNTEAFQKAIKECTDNGGGKVIVPKGRFLTGPIHLENNVNLHLEEGSEILFSTDPSHYYPLVNTAFEGIELINYSPLIYANNKKNIAITGKGILNGQASKENWWTWKGSKDFGWEEGMPSQKDSLNLPRLMDMADKGVAADERVFGNGHYLRPSFFEPFECENVMIKGVKIINAPFWIIHPFKSNYVIVDGVTVESHGPNNDGCDPEYSKNVVIKNCVFNTGDDCIAIKAGRDTDGRRVGIKSENIIVKNCKMVDGHGGVVIGSEMSAGVSNVFVENCAMDSPNLDRAIRIKTNSRRGGFVDGVYVKNLEIGQVKEAVLKVNMFYATYNNQIGDFIPTVKNIFLENIKVKNGGYYGILAKGYEESPIKNITFKNVVIEKVDKAYEIENVINMRLIDTYINGSLMESPSQNN